MDDIGALVDSAPLAWIVPHAEVRAAILMPVVFERGDESAVLLLGHLPRRAPAAEVLARDPAASILILGPHRHIPNAWIADRAWAPTWNFAAARIDAEVEIDAGLTDRCLQLLVDHLDLRWSPQEMGARYERLKQDIIGFAARPLEFAGRFKLGQDEKPENFAAIVAALGSDPLAGWMHRFAGR
ncbi:MAG: FMN-binding negative transcriptional regulator [Sphingopyxis sp.]|nr:FMN-binding negative transcriptional regulator [Sphingopyxis sp.]